jgi:hypothetical protein
MDASHFQQLIDTWYDPLYRFALSLARNSDDALDLTQQTFARRAEKGHTLREQDRAKSWLFTVLYREYLDSRRQEQREVPGETEALLDGQSPTRPALAHLGVIGCQTWKTSRGNISLVCFVGEDRKVAHLYVFEQLPVGFDGENLPGMDRPRLQRTGDWSLALWQSGGRGYVLGLPIESGPPPDIERYFRV